VGKGDKREDLKRLRFQNGDVVPDVENIYIYYINMKILRLKILNLQSCKFVSLFSSEVSHSLTTKYSR
jgi:hypothetical protein